MQSQLEITTVSVEVTVQVTRRTCTKCGDQLGTFAPQNTGTTTYCHVCRWLLRNTTLRVFMESFPPTLAECQVVGSPGPDRRDLERRQKSEPIPAKVLDVEFWPDVDPWPNPPSLRYNSTLEYFQTIEQAILDQAFDTFGG